MSNEENENTTPGIVKMGIEKGVNVASEKVSDIFDTMPNADSKAEARLADVLPTIPQAQTNNSYRTGFMAGYKEGYTEVYAKAYEVAYQTVMASKKVNTAAKNLKEMSEKAKETGTIETEAETEEEATEATEAEEENAKPSNNQKGGKNRGRVDYLSYAQKLVKKLDKENKRRR
jgi:hypothetical protein